MPLRSEQKTLPFGLRQARNAFKQSTHKRPVGCAYICGKRIYVGHNALKTLPLSKELGCRFNRIHAEIAVLRKVSANMNHGILYIYRERKNGSPGMARPCHSCMKLIRKKGIKKIIYTTYDGFAKETLDEVSN